jgi:hemoglobin
MDLPGAWRTRAAAVSLSILLVAGSALAQDNPAAKTPDQKSLDKQIRALLPKVINSGADLFNEGDRAGCYRLYQGSLLTLRPLLQHHQDLQQAIDAAFADADKQRSVGARAFALRAALDKIRETLKETPGDVKPRGKPAATTSLWERLGGENSVRKVVDDLVALAAKDPKVNFDRNGKYKFDPVKIADLKAQLVDFISAASGGPFKYTGKSMKEVHKDMGIKTAEFDAFAADLKKALERNGVKPADVADVLKAVEGTRKDIVEAK